MDRMQQDFTVLCNESYIYEQYMQNYFRYRGYSVQDCASDPEYQVRDIDFIASMEGYKTLAIEVKADKQMYKTGNILVEHGHIRPSVGKTRGWFLTCDADIICYIDTVQNIVYMINWRKLKPLVREDYNLMRFNNPHDIGTITQGYLIPTQYLRDKGFMIEEFKVG